MLTAAALDLHETLLDKRKLYESMENVWQSTTSSSNKSPYTIWIVNEQSIGMVKFSFSKRLNPHKRLKIPIPRVSCFTHKVWGSYSKTDVVNQETINVVSSVYGIFSTQRREDFCDLQIQNDCCHFQSCNYCPPSMVTFPVCYLFPHLWSSPHKLRACSQHDMACMIGMLLISQSKLPTMSPEYCDFLSTILRG